MAAANLARPAGVMPPRFLAFDAVDFVGADD
jgi:hypothetical protein